MYNAIIFDLDGTLLNTLDDLSDAVNYCLNKFGYSKRSKVQIRSFVGNGIKKLMERALPNDIDEEEFQKIFTFYKEYYTSHCRIKTKPYEGIIDLLLSLKDKGYRLAIVSNKNDAAVKELADYYFKNIFELSIGQRDGIRKKPAPDSLNEAIRILGVEKKNVLYVGDSEVDKQTADNAEVDCTLVDWGFRDREDLEKLKPKSIISKPEELIF